jgi:hypothetical protein
MRSFAALLLTAAFSLHAQAPAVRDSAGIRIFDYREITPARRIVVSPTPITSVGDQGTSPADLLDGIINAARLSDGRLLVAQSKIMGQSCGSGGCSINGSLLAAIYDPTGKVQSIFARMGRGPGELSQSIVGLYVLKADTIVLADSRGGIILYDRAGKYISQFQLEDPMLRGTPMMIGLASNDNLVAIKSMGRYNGVSAANIPEGLVAYRDTLAIKEFTRSGSAASTIAVIPGDSVSFTHTITATNGGGTRYSTSSRPRRGLRPSLCWTSSICKGTGNGNDVGVYSGGRLTQILRFPPPTAVELNGAAIQLVQGPRDELWIGTTSDSVSRWWVVASDGRLIGTSDLGKASLFQVGIDFVVVLRTDADGVQFVEVRRRM